MFSNYVGKFHTLVNGFVERLSSFPLIQYRKNFNILENKPSKNIYTVYTVYIILYTIIAQYYLKSLG